MKGNMTPPLPSDSFNVLSDANNRLKRDMFLKKYLVSNFQPVKVGKGCLATN